MRNLSLHSLFILVLPLLFLCPRSQSQQAEPTAALPDDPNGLRKLLDEMLAAAKQDDRTKLHSLIRDTEIPNYAKWFTRTFGQEKGESWAGPYGRMLQKDQKDFEELLIKLSLMEGGFSIQKLDSAKRYDTLTGPLDEYLVAWNNPGAPKGQETQSIADFFFIEGKFRWDSTSHYFPFQTQHASVVPGKLVKRVSPEYPAEARQKSIQGTVVLNVILHKDGSVTVRGVAEGDPLLSPAAIAAVQQWRYEPWSFNGQPIDLETKISVVFALDQ
jgi:TonB family protein